MISKRLSSTIATGLWVAGALLVGQALHVSVVTGEAAITDPAPVFYTIAGIALILIAQNLDFHPSEYLDYVASDDEKGETGSGSGGSGSSGSGSSGAGSSGAAGGAGAGGADAAFDPEASPLDEQALENLEAREKGDLEPHEEGNLEARERGDLVDRKQENQQE